MTTKHHDTNKMLPADKDASFPDSPSWNDLPFDDDDGDGYWDEGDWIPSKDDFFSGKVNDPKK